MIQTPRLTLRRHQIDDYEAYIRLWAIEAPDPSGVPAFVLDAEQVWARLLRFIGHWTTFGYAPFLVIDRATGGLIGEAGYADCRRGFGDGFDGWPEGMWRVLPAHRGTGIATDAMRAATNQLDASGLGQRAVCIIDPRNLPSMSIARRFGFEPFGERTFRGAQRQILKRCQRDR